MEHSWRPTHHQPLQLDLQWMKRKVFSKLLTPTELYEHMWTLPLLLLLSLVVLKLPPSGATYCISVIMSLSGGELLITQRCLLSAEPRWRIGTRKGNCDRSASSNINLLGSSRIELPVNTRVVRPLKGEGKTVNKPQYLKLIPIYFDYCTFSIQK